jgi:hypothetical protein
MAAPWAMEASVKSSECKMFAHGFLNSFDQVDQIGQWSCRRNYGVNSIYKEIDSIVSFPSRRVEPY